MHTYDLVFFCPDHYGQGDGGDRFRAKVLGLQGDVAQSLHDTCGEAGISLVDIPPGLTVEARVEFIAGQLRDRGLPPALGTVIAS